MKPHQKLKALIEELKALGAKSEWTDEDAAEETRIKSEIAEVKAAIERETKRANIKNEVAELDTFLNEPATNLPQPSEGEAPEGKAGAKSESRVEIARYGSVKNFTGATRQEAEKKAHAFGHFILGSLLGVQKSAAFCQKNGIALVETKAQSEGRNEFGGFDVPHQFANDLIDLRESYGVFRRNAALKPMTSDTRSDPRRTGGLTAYYVSEGQTITDSQISRDRVNLTAKKLACLALMSSEVNEDSLTNWADELAGEIAYAFANAEDEAGFNGDGTSTYGRITGVTNKMLGLSATRANIAGLVVGSGNAWSELVLADFEAVVARLPQYADTPAAKWFCHRTFYFNVMVKLMLAAGGATAQEIKDGVRQPMFLGYPVEFAQVLPKAEANDQIPTFLGDLRKAASFGDRRSVSLKLSDEYKYAEDQLAIRGTQRYDINVHSVGNASGTANSRVAGPIVGLLTAAS